jgi:hypothetical protein
MRINFKYGARQLDTRQSRGSSNSESRMQRGATEGTLYNLVGARLETPRKLDTDTEKAASGYLIDITDKSDHAKGFC